MAIAEKILNQLNISKPQKKFLMTLFTTILIARGKINFRNLSRYSHLCERTYTRQFDNPFRFMDINRWQDLSRFTYHHTQDGIALYSLVLNHQCFKRNVKVVVLVNEKIKETKKKNYALLFSTDKDLDAQTLVT